MRSSTERPGRQPARDTGPRRVARAVVVARLREDHHARPDRALAEELHGALPPRRADRQVEHDDVGPPGRELVPGLVGARGHDDGQRRLTGPPRDEQVVQQPVRDDEHLDGTHDPRTLGMTCATVVLKMEEKPSAIRTGTVL